MIKRYLSTNDFKWDFKVTEYAGQAIELAQEAVINKYNAVVAIGGDGTVNEVARVLVNTRTALGIIPFGSGNGLARHLGIPLAPQKAIRLITKCNSALIDVGKMNQQYFFCTAGVGFDAIVSHTFDQATGRGWWTYINEVIKTFKRFQAPTMKIIIHQKEIEQTAFVVTVANACQYGNNALIAPQADITDGDLDICIISPFPKIAAYIMGLRLFTGSMSGSAYVKYYKLKEATISCENFPYYHLDGDAYPMDGDLKFSILPRALKVWTP